MKSLRPHIRRIAAFLVIQFVGSLVFPTVVSALTSGPATPETTSFEPIDTTDMVNPLTGDLTYNIPLLEVPGPSGGYPLALSYHAGIMTNEDASWVGLGWSLNPGAINRSVSGWADDHDNVEVSNRFYWEGGEKKTWNIGLTLGIAGVGGVSAGVSLGHDTYQGHGVGAFVGANLGIGDSPLSVGINGGVDPWGSPYMSAGLSTSLGNNRGLIGASTGIGLSTNFKSVSGYASGGLSVSYDAKSGQRGGAYASRGGASLVGASISTGSGSGISISVGGQASAQNSKSGKVSIKTSGFTAPLPFVHIGYKYQRYWIDETDVTTTHGVLNYPDLDIGNEEVEWANQNHFKTNSYDTYHLLDPNAPGGIIENPEAYKVMGGTFPDADNYSVVAQGINGSFRPYKFKGYLHNQTKREVVNDNTIFPLINYPLGYDDHRVEFRFSGDFSNRHLYGSGSIGIDYSARTMDYEFDGSLTTGMGSSRTKDDVTPLKLGEKKFNSTRLAGSKHIEYWSNSEVENHISFLNGTGSIPNERAEDFGLIENVAMGFDRTFAPADQIGAYVMTNSSGVKYHFTLPAYSYDEYQYQENISKENGDSFSETNRPEKYAYTWHLTAITGPDFVDRGGASNAPNGVLDENDWGYWVAFDYGKWTDQYFWRNPGEGMSADLDKNFENFSEGTKEIYYLDAVRTKTHTALFVKDVRKDAKSAIKFQRNLKSEDLGTTWKTRPTNGLNQEHKDGGYESGIYTAEAKLKVGFTSLQTQISYYAVATKSLKLHKVYLFENDKYASIGTSTNSGDWPEHSTTSFAWDDSFSGLGNLSFDQHHDQNVIDIRDVDDALLTTNALRVIDLETDYSLTPGTANSAEGKLTLNSLSFKGKQGYAGLPSMKFGYGQNDVSKNPEYDKDMKDIWGFYKSDFDQVLFDKNYILGSSTSYTSSKQVDAWSLRSIQTSLGSSINIEYSSDCYSDVVYENESVFLIEDRTPLTFDDFDTSNGNDLVTFEVELSSGISSSDFAEVFAVDKVVKYNLVVSGRKKNGSGDVKKFAENYPGRGTVVGINGRKVKIKQHASVDVWPFEDFNPESNNDQARLSDWRIEGDVFPLEGLDVDRYGGGIRCDKLSINDPLTGRTSVTSYNYKKIGEEKSSGSTPYEPTILDNYSIAGHPDVGETAVSDATQEFKKEHYKNLENILSNSRELPPPGVMYSHVKIQESTIHPDGIEHVFPSYSTYEFETAQPESVTIDVHSQVDHEFSGYQPIGGTIIYQVKYARKAQVDVINNSARIGNLKKITRWDKKGHKTSETENLYLRDRLQENPNASRFGNIGVVQETYANARLVRLSETIDGVSSLLDLNRAFDLIGVISRRYEMPSIQIGSITTNYKTGITTESRNLAFDFLSGEVTAVYNKDMHGNMFVTKKVPAYRLLNTNGEQAYSQMGLPTDDLSNRNMLTQEGASYSYLMRNDYNPDDKNFEANVDGRLIYVEGVVGANLQTWSDNNLVLDGDQDVSSSYPSGIYRKKSSYSFIGLRNFDLTAGISDYSQFNRESSSGEDPFKEVVLESNDSFDSREWQKNAEITLYNVNSHALEATDINENYAATRMDPNNERVIATVANARYGEFTASSFEDSGEGGLTHNNAVVPNTSWVSKAHTGEYAIAASLGEDAITFSGNSDGTPIRVQFWSTAPDVFLKLNGGIVTLNSRISEGEWTLNEALLSVPIGDYALTVGSDGEEYIDDFRICPLDAAMTSYVYNEWGELCDILDANNLYTHYEYDGMGRLKSVTRETLKYGPVKTSDVEIKYARGQ